MPPLWEPSSERAAATNWAAFRTAVGPPGDLHRWSIADPAAFWTAVWDRCGVVGERGEAALVPGASLPEARFFPDARLNVVDTLLSTTGPGPALIEAGEDGRGRTI